MKTIGLLGGMSWESSLEYYRLINEGVKSRLGGLHSAKSLMYSVDFEEIERLQHEGNWEEATKVLIAGARNLEQGGADFLIICTNTMHKMAQEIQASIGIPLIHIAQATGKIIKEKGLHTIGLLGTRFTMEQDFYKGKLVHEYGLNILIPSEDDRQVVHDIIYNELCLGQIRSESKQKYITIIENLVKQGAEGIILGCTEIPLLIEQKDIDIPLFDTTRIHAEEAVEYSLR